MKKFIILSIAMVLTGFVANAQNYMVVNTETVFKSMTAYANAESSLETLGGQYQREIDDAYANVEKMYNEYMDEKAYLSESSRRLREDAILDAEARIQERQEELFGPEGELMKRRVDMVKPIQDKVFETINRYAQSHGFALVIDLANNPTVLYYSPSADKTKEIINLVK